MACWRAALTLPQREKLGVDDVVGAGISAGAESDGTAYPRSVLGFIVPAGARGRG